MPELAQMFTTKEVAESLRISPETVRDIVARVPGVNPMRLSDSPFAEMRWSQGDVDQLVQALKPVPVEPKARRRRKRAA